MYFSNVEKKKEEKEKVITPNRASIDEKRN